MKHKRGKQEELRQRDYSEFRDGVKERRRGRKERAETKPKIDTEKRRLKSDREYGAVSGLTFLFCDFHIII